MTVEPKPATLPEYNPALRRLYEWCAANFREDIPQMKCPFCDHHIPEKWQPLHATTNSFGDALAIPSVHIAERLGTGETWKYVTVRGQWMKCHNDECGHIILQLQRTLSRVPLAESISSGGGAGGGSVPKRLTSPSGEKLDLVQQMRRESEEWIAIPKTRIPAVNPLIAAAGFERDYVEAYSILKDSPRMAAVLARKILADLLKQYAGANGKRLTADIDAFIADKRHPLAVRNKLHYLREIGDVSAHTQENQSGGTIIEASPEEAEWSLETVNALFDYFIIEPAHERAITAALDEKIQKSGRKAIKPLTE